MAPRYHGRQGAAPADCKIMTCSGCEHEVLVQSGFSSSGTVYCMECAQDIMLNGGAASGPGVEGQSGSRELTPREAFSLRRVWSLLDSGSCSEAESALASLAPANGYVNNAWGVCYLRQNKVDKAFQMFGKLACLDELDDQFMMKLNPNAKLAWLSNFVLSLFFKKNQTGFDHYYHKLLSSPQLMTNHTFLVNDFHVLGTLHSQFSVECQRRGWMKRFLGTTPDWMNVIPDRTSGWREDEFDTR